MSVFGVATKFEVGDLVVATKDLRDDGTHPDPGVSVGDVLVPEGTRGEVLQVGLYLQEHVVYAVAFENRRVVGCLTRELEPAPAPDSPAVPSETSETSAPDGEPEATA
ncbi:MAG TPA: nitrogen fixation protein NifZ [Pseudonocardiaceae bacterium]